MKYAVLVYETADELQKRNDPEQIGPYMAPYMAFYEALEKGGAIAPGGTKLEHPETATTIRVRQGENLVQDGPFADTREMLGGLFMIDVESMDEAIQWAAKCPAAATGCVEVRPVSPDPE